MKPILALLAVLALVGCGPKGMDHVLSLKDIVKLEAIAGEMNSDDELLFRQTVMAEVARLSLQLGLSAMADNMAGAGDPSRDKASPQFDEAVAKLQSFEGKTARAATLEILQSLKSALQVEQTKTKAAIEDDKFVPGNPQYRQSSDLAELQERIATLDRKIASISKTK